MFLSSAVCLLSDCEGIWCRMKGGLYLFLAMSPCQPSRTRAIFRSNSFDDFPATPSEGTRAQGVLSEQRARDSLSAPSDLSGSPYSLLAFHLLFLFKAPLVGEDDRLKTLQEVQNKS